MIWIRAKGSPRPRIKVRLYTFRTMKVRLPETEVGRMEEEIAGRGLGQGKKGNRDIE